MADRSGARKRAGGAAAGTARPGGQAARASLTPSTDPKGLDRIIHGRARLSILSALAVNDTLAFNDLKTILDMTDGNLSAHARKLEDAGYLRCVKSFRDRLPHTEYSLTDVGREALERYLAHMEQIIRMARGEAEGT